MGHYRCHSVWARDTNAMRVTDTIAWEKLHGPMSTCGGKTSKGKEGDLLGKFVEGGDEERRRRLWIGEEVV